MDVKLPLKKVLQLFNGHDELILAFNAFVPQKFADNTRTNCRNEN